jgi:hypothetical protein
VQTDSAGDSSAADLEAAMAPNEVSSTNEQQPDADAQATTPEQGLINEDNDDDDSVMDDGDCQPMPSKLELAMAVDGEDKKENADVNKPARSSRVSPVATVSDDAARGWGFDRLDEL